MDVSLKWLKDYVDLTAPADELAHRLTMAGVEVEEIERIGAAWEKVFVGKVVALRPHPNADNLQLVDVDYGEERRATVVTGAKNLEVGNVVPLAQLGARLANYRKPGNPIEELKPRDLRGIVSQGMVCSAVELGLGEESDGIMHLDPSARIGAPLAEELGDVIFHLKVTPNRSDCLAMLGVAREIAAITGRQSRQPDVAVAEPGAPAADAVTVQIGDPELCPRYIAKIIRGVKIGPSPKWLQDRLVAGGMRPINNVVDVTNYVMLELGQPLHAFDYDKIGGRQIVVRRARPGERLTTLDGVDRELTPEMLVIADAAIPVALAGVMGGADSEVSDTTTTVLLESASFHPVSIRRAARELRLPSEASRRFERTVPTENALPAARRAAQLIAELSGGAVAAGEVDAYPRPVERRRARLELAEIRRLLGVDFAPAEVERILGALGFTLRRDGDAYDVEVPPYRVDVSRPADLVEELVRIRGYDVIPETLPTGAMPEPL
ncbi:MAG: phenylalanine--tRNA ligase subunit beta, partial [Chloroflexi bacterium]|nr:phenylalanine--tRNA ligase subunit beta [Chloroflexota bacterium]